MCTHYSNIYLLKNMTMNKKDYIDYMNNQWVQNEKNLWRSFTYWSALYDYINEYRADLDDLDIRESIVDSIASESQADRDWIEWLSDRTLVELVDISLLDELWREIQEQVSDEDIEDIFDDLDLIPEFETREEFENKVQELTEDKWNTELNWRTIAERYEDEHYLSIKEEENV